MWMSSLSLEQNHTHTVKSEHYDPCLYLPSLQPNNHMKQIPLILQGETPFATNLGVCYSTHVAVRHRPGNIITQAPMLTMTSALPLNI